MKTGFRTYRLLLLSLLLLLTSAKLFAIDERWAAKPLKGNQLRKDSISEVQDTTFYTPSLLLSQTSHNVRNIITFKINEFANLKLPDVFKVSIKFKVYYTRKTSDIAGTSDSTSEITLTIDYNKGGYYEGKAIYTFKGGYSSKVVIREVVVTSGTLADFENSLMLENEILVNREYSFNCTNNAVDTISHADSSSTKGELRVYWAKERPADEYDLEWTYIDSSALLNYRKVIDTSKYDPRKLFTNNATRVSITKEQYYIPLLYDGKGLLFYRVRSVQVKLNGQRIESAWSSDYLLGLGQYAYNGHERPLNWQATTSFAEEGKRKSVVQYFDGSLRNRQTVTKDNTTDTTIVAETFYDYQGRPVIQVLPTPSLSSIIKFTPNYNAAVNGGEYEKDLYDGTWSDSCYCTVGAPPMDSTKGSAQYYSPANQNVSNGFNKYIPDARKYAFTETRYTADNTGRIAIQSGVGYEFQIGRKDSLNNTHETKYTYGSADQEDLNALFGTEAGKASHYTKNMVRDANGQYSVSYVDMHGRTIATALAGKPTSKLDTLNSNITRTITKKLLDSNNNILKGIVIESSRGLLVTKAGNNRFVYSLIPDSINIKDCNNAGICYDCKYDLEITITDECNNTSFPNNAPVVITRSNVSGYDSLCNDTLTVFPTLDTTVYLKEGNYLITKKLSISQKAMDYYRDSVFMRRNACKTLDTFIRQQKDILYQQIVCQPTCESCEDSLGTWTTFRPKYLEQLGIDNADTAAYRDQALMAYNGLLQECNALCSNTGLHDDIRQRMLADITPPFGQYANQAVIDEHSVFRLLTTGKKAYSDVAKYLDESGKEDRIPVKGELKKPQELSIDDFVNNFKPSWAEALLVKHPEYCKLQQFELRKASHIWDEKFGNTQTFQAAKDSGYLNPVNFTGLPSNFTFTYYSQRRDPLFAGPDSIYKQQFKDSLFLKILKSSTPKDTISAWSLANLIGRCKDGDTYCLDKYKKIDSAFVADSCSGSLDMAWISFREMYLQEKREILNKILVQACPSQVYIDPVKYFINFPDPNQLPSGVPNTLEAAQDSLKSFTDNNCIAYATQWWQELAPCNFNNPGDSARIISRLVQICKEGSDADHSFGASSVRPSSTYNFRSFEQFLKFYCDSVGENSPYNLTCNVYLISSPGLYEQHPPYYVKPVFTKPDTCECNNISSYYQQYRSYGQSDANFSAFINRTTGVSVSNGALDSLRNICNGTISCNFLKEAIDLPTIFQCGSDNVCVNCGVVDSTYRKFKLDFPGIAPSYDDVDSIQRIKNSLFVKYMNSKLGFAKSTSDYLDFMSICDTASTFSSDTLYDILSDYSAILYFNDTAKHYDAYGCDTTHWKFNYSGTEKVPPAGGSNTYDFTVPLGQVFVSGAAVHPQSLWPTTGNVRGVSFDYKDRLCMGDGKFVYKVRIMAPDTSLTTNYEYIGLMALNFDNYGANTFLRMEIHKTFLYMGINGSYTTFTTPITLSFNTWHDMSVKFNNDSIYVYYDATLLAVKYLGVPTSRLSYFYTGLGSRQPKLDYMKLLDLSDNILFSDTFTACNQTVINVPRFKSSTCSSDFAAYFNQRKGTSYSFIQVDSVYYSRTGNHVNVCADDCNVSCDTLRSYYNYFKAHYDSLVTRVCDTTAAGLVLSSGENISCCQVRFKDYINAKLKQAYPFSQIQAMYARCGITIEVCQPLPTGPTLCGKTVPFFPPATIEQHSPCDDSTSFAIWKGTLLYESYRDSIKDSFDDKYLAKCLKARFNESFTVTQPTSEYHYTLYYYDQAGNLLKTIPPEGVDLSKFSVSNWSYRVDTARSSKSILTPDHTLRTDYRYNTLNQVVVQKSPDGGISEFWYDRLGRLAISRNAKQKSDTVTSFYSYTKYDYLGRINEVGQIKNTSLSDTMKDVTSRNPSTLNTWLTSRSSLRGQITETVYDLPYEGFLGLPGNMVRLVINQRNLRNRVSYVRLVDSGNNINHSAATYYTYDIHGNVDTLLQDYGRDTVLAVANMMNRNNGRFKKIIYKYDLISGKVNMVQYQPNWGDQFIHRYSYDAENRLTLVETSTDSLVWEREGRYEYYKHGPLARMVIGEQLVQGIDYAYTLQGWLKGTNSTSATSTHDMGGDGRNSGSDTLNRYTARDIYSYTLNYFTGDYRPINAGVQPFPGYSAYLGTAYRPLYNGNISSMATHLRPMSAGTMVGGPIMLYNYRYDQLNRLTAMDSYNDFSTSTNSWTGIGSPMVHYNERISYDANGNILRYKRNADTWTNGPVMDSLKYKYYAGTNRLSSVEDSASDGGWGSHDYDYNIDIDNQSDVTNYKYDAIGNLTSDVKEQISSIKWSVYGKILEINRTATSQNPVTKIVYKYDAQGNRIGKIVSKSGTSVRDHSWYVRDAQGNTMAVYVASGSQVDSALNGLVAGQNERYIYGSSRLGVDNWYMGSDSSTMYDYNYPGLNAASYTYRRGWKQYELSNHLGNVLVSISDKKIGVPLTGSSLIDYYEPEVKSAQDYYPFGMLMPKRSFSGAGIYRYGFNGKENDNDVKGLGNQQDYGMRIYDPRLGRFLSMDPIFKEYPHLTPYQFASNRPIDGIDLDGMEYAPHIFGKYDYNGSWGIFEWAKAIPNAAATIGNGGLDIYNSGVTNYQSLRKGTWTQDVSNDFKSLGSGIKTSVSETIHYHQTKPLKTQLNDAWNYFSSPQVLEDGLVIGFNAYFGNKFTPGKGALGSTTAKNILPATDDIFSASIKTRGMAERYALGTKYKGYFNANEYIRSNNTGFDLISTIEKKIVDVTTTTSQEFNLGGLYKKLRALDSERPPGFGAVLQVYIKEGQYSVQELIKFTQKLDEYIKNAGLNVTHSIDPIK